MPPDPTPDDFNPYRSPAGFSSMEKPSPPRYPAALIVLAIMAAGHLLVSFAMLAVGLVAGQALLLAAAVVCCGFYLAIVVGLSMRQEWARITLIWLCYVGIVSYLIQTVRSPWVAPLTLVLIAFEIATLVLGHNRSVRETTRGASLAKAYTYHETPPTGKEESQNERPG